MIHEMHEWFNHFTMKSVRGVLGMSLNRNNSRNSTRADFRNVNSYTDQNCRRPEQNISFVYIFS